jgi:hypothetical protein
MINRYRIVKVWPARGILAKCKVSTLHELSIAPMPTSLLCRNSGSIIMINSTATCSHYEPKYRNLHPPSNRHALRHNMSLMLCAEEHSTINACQHAIMHVGIIVTKALA